MVTIATNCSGRKEMVRKISELLGIPSVYLRTPSYAFQIGDITVNRDASITTGNGLPDSVAQLLLENGYIDSIPAAECDMQTEPVTVIKVTEEQTDEPAADSEAPAEVDRIAVSIPLNACPPQGLINILKTLYARQNLITAMTRCDYICIDEELTTLLEDTKPDSLDRISELLKQESDIGMVKGISMDEGKLTLETTYNKDNPTGWNSFAELLFCIAAKAMRAHHVSGKRLTPEDSETKYFCRNWLVQLGLGGPEHKELRSVLLGHLHGFAAFRTSEKMDAHKRKYAELRRQWREDTQADSEAAETEQNKEAAE